MKPRDAVRRLRTVDQPRMPNPTFARELRRELLDAGADSHRIDRRPTNVTDDVVSEDEPPSTIAILTPQAPPTKSRRWLAVAAAVVVVAISGTALLTTRGGNDPVVATVSPEVKKTVEAACARFKAEAFGIVDQEHLVGASNKGALALESDPRGVIVGLQQGLVAFGLDLRAAGVDETVVQVPLARAAGRASAALSIFDARGVAGVATRLGEIDLELTEVERQLANLGMAQSCL